MLWIKAILLEALSTDRRPRYGGCNLRASAINCGALKTDTKVGIGGVGVGPGNGVSCQTGSERKDTNVNPDIVLKCTWSKNSCVCFNGYVNANVAVLRQFEDQKHG
jgi:hypothetical protein